MKAPEQFGWRAQRHAKAGRRCTEIAPVEVNKMIRAAIDGHVQHQLVVQFTQLRTPDEMALDLFGDGGDICQHPQHLASRHADSPQLFRARGDGLVFQYPCHAGQRAQITHPGPA